MKRPARRKAHVRRLPAAQRREDLLDVARDVLLGEGLRALTMERLAERAGVSKGLGYAYFRDVEDVTLALWDREIGEVYRRIEDATADARSVDEVIDRAVRAYLDVLGERGTLLGALQAQLSHGRLEERIRGRVRGFLRFWRNRLGAFVPLDRAGALAAAAMAPGAVDACARLWVAGVLSRSDTERLARAFVLAGTCAVAGATAAAKGSGASARGRARPVPRRRATTT